MPKSHRHTYARGMTRTALAWVCVVALVPACGDDAPTAPSGTPTIAFRQVTPPSGGTIVVSAGTPPGAFIVRESGQLSITMDISGTRDADFAVLDVHLVAENPPGSNCGQNLPDAPTWGPWIGRRAVRVTVSGFQIYRLPCDVIGIRAIVHLGPGSSGIIPMPTRTLADGTLPVVYHLRR